jgi:FkbM family methyltransferase
MRRLHQHLVTRMELASSLASLAPSPWERVYLGLVPFVMVVWQRIPWLKDRWLHLRLHKLGRTFTCVVSDSSELFVLADVFGEEQYQLPERFTPRTILDLGSHIGASIIYFRLKYPQASIYGFEPHPETFRKLERNVSQLPNVRVFRVAATATDGPAKLFEGRGSWASSLRADRGNEEHGLAVGGKALDTMLRDLGLRSVDLIKIDIEGLEVEVLTSTASPEERTTVVIGELHDFAYDGGTDASALKAFLTSHGFGWESRQYRTDRVFVASAGGSRIGGA